ncbi:MAG: DUF167 domain-containing protein [Rhodocyclaceae bacterium]|nr:DUF167 domain-containing protein [Rhodocyclaceae bacterium]
MGWLDETSDGAVLLSLRVQPNARRTEFCGAYGDAIKLRLAAPPVDGKANAALVAFLAEFCGLPQRSVTVVGGASSRSKRVRLCPASPALLVRLRALR